MIYWKTLTTTGKLVAAAVVLLVLGLVLLWGYNFITAKPKAEAALAKNQVEAVQRSAEDAIKVVGKAQEREAASADLTQSNDKEIRNAQGADAQVDPAVRDAGLRSLCRRASYRGDPKCLRLVNP